MESNDVNLQKRFWVAATAGCRHQPTSHHPFRTFPCNRIHYKQRSFSVQRLGTETFVTVSFGKSWQIYNCAKRSLVLVGPQITKKIRALATEDGDPQITKKIQALATGFTTEDGDPRLLKFRSRHSEPPLCI